MVDFAFSQAVVDVFPDMIRRSVPGYETVLPIGGMIAAQALPPGGRLYDLGCSQGASTAAVLARLDDRDCNIIGIDNSEPMLTSARALIVDPRVTFVEADLTDFRFESANVVLANYVLQFLEPAARLALLKRLRTALAPGGLMLLTEKIHLDDPALDATFDALHLDFKRANGYSELEVAGKRSALERVMRIDREADHRARLREAGFSHVELWFRCLNWASFIIRP
ncbi:MAG: carboxy-S-adenosyl-L-methionine synthase CmoA [Pseudomonadota bacterium]